MRKGFIGRSLMVLPFLLSLFLFAGLSNASAATLYGVSTTNQLVRFDSATPTMVTTVGVVAGLQTGENIVGIDFRPANGQLYALGSASRLYTMNLTTGAANFVAALSVPLNGISFGTDFNPVADRLRITSDAKQNLSVNAETGQATADSPLTAAGPSPARSRRW